MRKMTSWLLMVAIISINLLGCNKQEQNIDMSCETNEVGGKVVDELMIRVPNSPGNSLVAYDPNREIYFSCEDMDMNLDIYFWNTWRTAFDFYVLSVRELDMSSMQISIPIESSYSVSFSQCNVWRGTEYMASEQGLFDGRVNYNECFPYYLYQVYRGMDFKYAFELAQLTDKTEYYRYIDSELGSYKHLDKEDIPLFFAYEVSVVFDSTYSVKESFSELSVTLEGVEYRFDIGKVTLNPNEKLCDGQLSQIDLNESAEGEIGQWHSFYSNGLARDISTFRITARDNMIITGLSVLKGDVEIRDILVTISSSVPISFRWDGNKPIEVNKGEIIDISIVFDADQTQKIGYNIQTYFQLYFQTESESSCLLKELVMTPIHINLHELYAIVFMGVDMESYYQDYYYPIYEPWRSEYIH